MKACRLDYKLSNIMADSSWDFFVESEPTA